MEKTTAVPLSIINANLQLSSSTSNPQQPYWSIVSSWNVSNEDKMMQIKNKYYPFIVTILCGNHCVLYFHLKGSNYFHSYTNSFVRLIWVIYKQIQTVQLSATSLRNWICFYDSMIKNINDNLMCLSNYFNSFGYNKRMKDFF